MNSKLVSTLLIGCFLLTGCSFSFSTLPTPTPSAPTPLTFISTETPAPIPQVTAAPIFTSTAVDTITPPAAVNICTDPQVTTLIDSLKKAILTSNGGLLSSLVSPNGIEVRWVRYGNVIKYDQDQAKFLFETKYEADWGAEPGSGQNKTGSFHDVIVPEDRKSVV